MEIRERIELAQRKLKDAETAKTVAETQLAEAKKATDGIIEDMQKLGVTPETIEAEIAQLEKDIETSLTEIEQAIPTIS